MAEAGVPESTMLARMGHTSRYSHIRMAAKRDAVEALSIVGQNAKGAENSKTVPTVRDAAKIRYA